MKKISPIILLILFSKITFSQCDGRYQSEIFSVVNKTTVNYSDVYTNNAHEMDIYTPNGDTETNRPVILYMHGGSFYGGDKTSIDCIDFCENMAKRGYVTASVNYRLANIISFLTSNESQYETVLETVSDIKSAIRYLRKNFANGDTYNIDPNTIFVAGYSAGGVIAIHLAYIDSIADLPTTPINVQAIVNNVGGIYGLEGDAGNYGYSSHVSGVISLAGGINVINWIDANDEPLISIQGTADLTVNYNCGPGMNNPAILNLCGSGEMHSRADAVGLLNNKLIFNGADHAWAALGNSNSKFIQALEFTTNSLYPLLPCNQITSLNTNTANKKILTKIVDVLGRQTIPTKNTSLFYIYSDGSIEHKIICE